MKILACSKSKRKDGKAHITVKRMDDGSTVIKVKVLADRKTRTIQRDVIRVYDEAFVRILEMWQACANEVDGIGESQENNKGKEAK